MTEALETIVWYVVCGMLGWAAGTITQYRQYRLGKVSLLVPFVPKSSRNFTIVVATLSLLTTFSVITSQVAQQHQARCNADFQAVIRDNAEINREDRDLERRDDRLRDARDDALDNLVRGIAAGERSPASPMQLLREYTVTVRANDAERELLERQREQLEQQRRDNPYPTPRCD
ncbi:hypothetical protein [Rhodococcus pyridinivorans]|uniref:Uncharacterized protein n=1 Tax=Rhodococcus pyridinivorans TaxID=103816 RepID=A0A7M2XNU5_9NOCA|nr:hypothetical protein [Rhodococcus pyridinivorans]QOV99498.1 hypothetical protein INP59_03590 [Rhodococcus pyridinivorans]